MKFILDGYNIIRTLPIYLKTKIKEEKYSLLKIISKHPLLKKSKNKIIVVFDGYDNNENNLRSKRINIVFSENKSADDVIKRMVKNERNVKDVRVITDDREIRDYVRIMGAKSISVKEFAEVTKKNENKQNEEVKINGSEADEVTNELKNIWQDDI